MHFCCCSHPCFVFDLTLLHITSNIIIFCIQISNLSCVKQHRYKNCFIVSNGSNMILLLLLIALFLIFFMFPRRDFYNSACPSCLLQRVLFDNQVRETAVRSSSMIQHATSWDGVITFNNIQVRAVPYLPVHSWCCFGAVFLADAQVYFSIFSLLFCCCRIMRISAWSSK